MVKMIEVNAQLDEMLRRSEVNEIALALDKVQTVEGAVEIHKAETVGLRRGAVLRLAERRVAQLRGEQAPGDSTILIAQGDAIETPPARIVEAVGFGRNHRKRFQH